MGDYLMIGEEFVALEEDFSDGVAFVAVEFAVVFYSKVIDEKWGVSLAVVVDYVNAIFLVF